MKIGRKKRILKQNAQKSDEDWAEERKSGNMRPNSEKRYWNGRKIGRNWARRVKNSSVRPNSRRRTRNIIARSPNSVVKRYVVPL